MSILRRKTPFVLLLGDITAFVAALWIMLFVRYQTIPSEQVFFGHFSAFLYLFLIWIVVYFIGGLYERDSSLFRSAIPPLLLNIQFVNAAIAVGYFYFAPTSPIAPKTNLFLYFAVATVLILIWRGLIFRNVSFDKKEDAVLIGSGVEIKELQEEVANNPYYHFKFTEVIDADSLNDTFLKRVTAASTNSPLIVIDLYNDKVRANMSHLYNLLLSHTRFIDINRVYEGVFGRVALSLLRHNWFLENISNQPRVIYDILKRVMDFIISIPVLVVAGVLLPFVALAIKIEDSGPIFIKQERVGRGNKIINVYKIRTMRRNDAASSKWGDESGNKITRFGSFLRKTSIDELPQVWNILKGEISFIGPRSDISGLGTRLSEEIPYYNTRYLIKPGISGWAQVNQKYSPGNISPQSVEETKVRLSYDLYYVKNRSFVLDLKIALRTIKTLLSRIAK